MYMWMHHQWPWFVCMHATTVDNWPRWDISTLWESIQQYLGNGITSSIKRTYAIRIWNYVYRFLYINTKSTDIYHWKNPATISSSLGYATFIEHSSINVYLSAVCNLHIISETIITSKLTPCCQCFSMVSKNNRLQTRVRCAIRTDPAIQISTNSITFLASCV